jgi:flavin-dependent dehydrogenase
VGHLLDEAEKAGVSINYEFGGYQFEKRVALISVQKTKAFTEVQYDLLVGADGSSRVCGRS